MELGNQLVILAMFPVYASCEEAFARAWGK